MTIFTINLHDVNISDSTAPRRSSLLLVLGTCSNTIWTYCNSSIFLNDLTGWSSIAPLIPEELHNSSENYLLEVPLIGMVELQGTRNDCRHRKTLFGGLI